MLTEILLIGSSEGTDHASYLIEKLNAKFMANGFYNNEYHCLPWREGQNWQNGSSTFTSLYKRAESLLQNDGYVIAMFSPDDVVTLRGKKYCIGRDNVWLEYGLFAGVLGAERVFTLIPSNGSTFGPIDNTGKAKYTISEDNLTFHLPSDMNGMYQIPYRFNTPYRSNDAEMELSIIRAIDDIYTRINPKHKFTPPGSATPQGVISRIT